MLLTNPTLNSLIQKLWDSFWSGGISNPLTAIEQITYLLFMKRLDDLETKRERDAEFLKVDYISRFSGKYHVPGTKEEDDIDKNELRWSQFKRKPADEMLLFVQTKVFPFLKELNGGSSFTKSMENAVFIIPKPSLLVEAINIIEQIFTEIEKDANEKGQAFQDIQGDVYEMLLSEIAASGKNGQFRTPRHIIKLMTELVEPKLGQKIADPACGTAGFLLGAYQYMLTDLVRKTDASKLIKDEDGFERGTLSSLVNEDVKNIIQETLFGYDFEATMVRLGLMNLMMHGIDQPHIAYQDTLSKKYNEDNLYDVVMANPPFTGNIDKGDINTSLKTPTTKTELLFVERIYNMLKIGGTAAVIVPQGVLFGSGKAFKDLRKKLIERTELKAVITMPGGVFKPYAGVSTAILVFTKVHNVDDKISEPDTTKTWFYEMQSDGYSLDDKRTKFDDSGDLQDIVEKYHEREKQNPTDRTAKFFFVPIEEIIESGYDLSLSKYKEEVYEEIRYDPPQKILDALFELEIGKQEDAAITSDIEGGIIKGLKELRDILK